MQDEMKSLYERIGGEETVIRLVDSFYERVFQDDDLVDFFNGAQVGRLKQMQKEFFTIALGGPSKYSDINLAHAHKGRNIETSHFRAFVQHLFDTIAEFDFSEEERYQIITDINTYVEDIVDDSESLVD